MILVFYTIKFTSDPGQNKHTVSSMYFVMHGIQDQISDNIKSNDHRTEFW